MKMKILTLMVRHGTEKYKNAVDDIVDLFARQMQGVDWDLVVVDNTLPEGYCERLGKSQTLVGGSNAHREFSSWDSGIAYVSPRLATYDLVHLATEAFRTLYTRYLDRITAQTLELILGRGAAVGHIDYYNSPVLICARRSQAWLRSSFVFLPPAELSMLGSLVSIKTAAAFFSGDPSSPFRETAPLSENYRAYIQEWLTGEGTGQGVEWHSRFTLSPDTLSVFEDKATAILNEHLLSVRLRAQGCAMVDAIWLATRASTLSPRQGLGVIPNWRDQLISRDTDAVARRLLFGSLQKEEAGEPQQSDVACR